MFDRETKKAVVDGLQLPVNLAPVVFKKAGPVSTFGSPVLSTISAGMEAANAHEDAGGFAGILDMDLETFKNYSSTVKDFLDTADTKTISSVGKGAAGSVISGAGASLAGYGAAALIGAEGGAIAGLPGMAIGAVGGLIPAILFGASTDQAIGVLFGEKPSAAASMDAMKIANSKLHPPKGTPPAEVTQGDVISIISYQMLDSERSDFAKRAEDYHLDIDTAAKRFAFDPDVIRIKAEKLFGMNAIPEGVTAAAFLAEKINQGAIPLEPLVVDNNNMEAVAAILNQKQDIAARMSASQGPVDYNTSLPDSPQTGLPDFSTSGSRQV